METLAQTDRRDGPGATLVEVISVADYINHAVLTREEIEGAVNRLGSAGLLLITGDRLALTPAGTELRERAAHRSVFERMLRIRTELQQLPVEVAAEPWLLSEQEHAEAVATYMSGFDP